MQRLKPIESKGFIMAAQGTDRRKRLVEVAPAGTRKLTEALPRWHQAHTALQATLGAKHAALFGRVLSDLRRTLAR